MIIDTPHIKCNKEDIAKTILMPGDPLRSKYIAENFLKDAKLINNIRGIQGYTGYYKDTKVTVMASGMGMPSMGIYSYELYKYSDVSNIIRIGSAGTISENLKVKDLIIADGALTNTNFNNLYSRYGISYLESDKDLVECAKEISNNNKYNYRIGKLYSSDTYYDDEEMNKFIELGALAAEMESAALFANAKKFNKRALAICTISNSILNGYECSAEERQTGFTEMMELALNVAVEMENK